MSAPGVLIVGGGLAGQRCAETLRRRGHDGSVRILCAEPERPYDRPPLSKALLAGEAGEASVAYRPAEWYEDNEVELLLGCGAERVDSAERKVTLADGRRLGYERLLVATGSRSRSLPFLVGYDNVHELRTLADARRLRPALVPGARLAIVGAGFIGQEVAATARRLGAEVTLIEALDVPLAGILGERIGRWFAQLHADEGTRVLLGARLEAARGADRIEELALADGTRIACDAVVVGVGSAPTTEWLGHGDAAANGVATDASGRTALPGVFAAGDAAAPFDPRLGVHSRSEHWDAAAWQGAAAADAMLGRYPGLPPLPSFWSDQYGTRIHFIGHATGCDGVFVEGDEPSRDFVAVYTRNAAPVAALAVGRPRAVPRLRKLIEQTHRTQQHVKGEAA